MKTLRTHYPICYKCGSEMVMSDALVTWDKVERKWVVERVLDSKECKSCGKETKIDWKVALVIDD